MPGTLRDRRELLKVMSAGAAAGFLAGRMRDAAAQQVKWSTGTEPPKLKAPANSCDCHHHIYDAKYPVDPRSVLRPGDALVEDYRAFQKRIGTSRNVIVTPSTYGTDNRVTLDAVVAFGPTARAVVVVDDTVADAELKRMHAQGARGIRFNLAQAGATTPEMIEPLSKRVNELGWHIQINATAPKIVEIMPILEEQARRCHIVRSSVGLGPERGGAPPYPGGEPGCSLRLSEEHLRVLRFADRALARYSFLFLAVVSVLCGVGWRRRGFFGPENRRLFQGCNCRGLGSLD